MGRDSPSLALPFLRNYRIGIFFLILVPLAFVGIFFFFPLVSIIQNGLTGSGFLEIWSSSSTWKIAWFTFWQAGFSTLLTLLAAWPMAYLLGNFNFKGKGLLSAFLIVPFVMPTIVVATAILAAQDRLGLRDELSHTVWAILWAHIFFNYALVARIVGNYWAQLNTGPELAAQTLGAGRFRTFWEITLPRLRPAVLSSASLVFFFSFTSFGIILILGGPTRATLDTEIWRFATQRLEFDAAAALTLLQVLAVGALALLSSWMTRYSPAVLGAEKKLQPIRSSRSFLSLSAALIPMSAILVLPVALMILESFSVGDGGLNLSAYRALGESGGRFTSLFVEPVTAIWNSLSFAAVAAAMALVLGSFMAYGVFNLGRKQAIFLEPIFLLPLGVSAVAVGFGFLIALDTAPLDFRSSWILVPLAHALIGLPFVIRPILSVLRATDSKLRWAAATLGASPGRVFWNLDLPLTSRAMATGTGFAFAISLGEFGAASFLARPDRPTLPVAIFRLLSRPGDLAFGQAMALSVILAALVGSSIFFIERLRPRSAGESFV